MADNRPSVYKEGGRLVIRASALGGCVRALVAARDDMDPVPYPSSLQEAMAESANLEEAVFASLAKDGYVIHSQQREVSLHFGATEVRGHIDAIATKQTAASPSSHLVEVKVFGDSYWDKWCKEGLDGFPQYQWQLSVYMLALGLPGLMAVGHKVDGELVDVQLVPVPKAPITLDQMATRVIEIETAIELPVCNIDMWPCPYVYTHVDDTPVMDDPKLGILVHLYQTHKEEEAKAKERKEEARQAILDALREAGQNKVLVDRWRVTRTVRTDTRVDMRQLRLAIDVAPYERTTETEQLRISELGVADG